MTPHEAQERVEKIKGMTDDPEMAHCEEDDLLWDFVSAVAKGECNNPGACAKEILKSKELDFPRWCA